MPTSIPFRSILKITLEVAGVIVLSLAVISVVRVVGWWERDDRLETGYAKIMNGVSKENLVEVAGPADGSDDCQQDDKNFRTRDCRQHYAYFSGFTTWHYWFDEQGRLVSKSRCILGEYCAHGSN